MTLEVAEIVDDDAQRRRDMRAYREWANALVSHLPAKDRREREIARIEARAFYRENRS